MRTSLSPSWHLTTLQRRGLMAYMLCAMISGCAGELNLDESTANEAKARDDWPSTVNFPLEQDLAILLPRSTDLRVGPQTLDASGFELLPFDWVRTVGDSFVETVVGDAFLTESQYADWHIAAIRIVPCSPFRKVPSPANDFLCWPAVRIVWQPTIHGTTIRRRVREHYSDDRAMHVLYHYFPPAFASEGRALLDVARDGRDFDGDRFIELRDAAIEALLDGVFTLRRQATASYGALGYRAELTGEFSDGADFINRLIEFLGNQVRQSDVHTVTAFSLPAGRLPGPIGLWTFVAFDVQDGRLTQQAIEIVDPDSGEVIGRLETDETVGIAEGDQRLIQQMDDSDGGQKLAELVIAERSDIDRLRERINDPQQTLVPNTSCATCHNFNRILFDFHNLSYFESLEMTIAPRVERDVQSEIEWTRRWRSE